MTSHLGYGSRVYRVTTSTASETDEVVATGSPCIVDKILINDASLSGDASIDLQTQDGTSLIKWISVDLSAADAHRNGISCGPLGIAFSDGLQVVTTDGSAGTAGTDYTIVYRTGIY